MTKIIILALLFLVPEKTNSRRFSLLSMLISDALPVQFWLTGCATFNEHYAEGIHHKCFYAPWQCDDEMKIQIKDDPSQNFSLEIYDSNEQLLESFPFEETQVGVYEYNFDLSIDSPDICDQMIRLKIRRDQGLQGISLPSFSSWVNDGGVGNPWTTGSNPSYSLTALGSNSERLYVDYAFIPGVTYNIILNYTSSAVTLGCQISVDITDAAFNVQFSNGIDVISSSGARTTNLLTFTATSDTTRISVRLSVDGATGTDVVLQSFTAQRTVGDSELVAKTDLLDVREDHAQTILFTYSNHRNFAGLVYENESPSVEFTIRIPAIFFHQRFPEEDEVMELSSEIVTLNSTLRKQRRLTTDYIPYYFHEKLKLILKHQNLTALGRQWVKQEAYEIVDGNNKYPLKMANCWLSEKDFVHRNVL